MQMPSIGLSQHRSTTRGQNAVVVFAQIIDDALFNVAKALLSFPFEKFSNGATQALLNHVV
jgi:hypothetical protein